MVPKNVLIYQPKRAICGWGVNHSCSGVHTLAAGIVTGDSGQEMLDCLSFCHQPWESRMRENPGMGHWPNIFFTAIGKWNEWAVTPVSRVLKGSTTESPINMILYLVLACPQDCYNVLQAHYIIPLSLMRARYESLVPLRIISCPLAHSHRLSLQLPARPNLSCNFVNYISERANYCARLFLSSLDP